MIGLQYYFEAKHDVPERLETWSIRSHNAYLFHHQDQWMKILMSLSNDFTNAGAIDVHYEKYQPGSAIPILVFKSPVSMLRKLQTILFNLLKETGYKLYTDISFINKYSGKPYYDYTNGLHEEFLESVHQASSEKIKRYFIYVVGGSEKDADSYSHKSWEKRIMFMKGVILKRGGRAVFSEMAHHQVDNKSKEQYHRGFNTIISFKAPYSALDTIRKNIIPKEDYDHPIWDYYSKELVRR